MNDPYTNLSNEELLQKWRQDEDLRAMHVLVKRYHGIIFAKALRRTRNIEDARDLTQHTFKNALEKKEWHADDFLPYTIGALNNNHLSESRDKARRKTLLPKDRSKDVSDRINIPSNDKTIEPSLGHTVEERIADAISEGLSDTEIAERLSIPLETVCSYRKNICDDLNRKFKVKKFRDYFLIKRKNKDEENKKQNDQNPNNEEDDKRDRA
jgi:DNA-directed RNA polymerase specialized sigma24 family protein